MDIDLHLATRVRDLRKAQGQTLENLAEKSGVSRSMISLIERGETSPTAAVLSKLAAVLGVTMASLFADEKSSTDSPLARHAQQQVWTDPETGYVRRHVSPPGFASPIDIAEVTFPPGKRVIFESASTTGVTHQQVWVLEGELEITLSGKTWRLLSGDCLAMVLGQQIAFKNASRKPARYAVVLTTNPLFTRMPL